MNKEEILELIELGFDPKLIQSEFGIPVETIQKYIDEKNEISSSTINFQKQSHQEQSKQHFNQYSPRQYGIKSHTNRQTSHTPVSTPVTINSNSKSRLDILREKYHQLYTTKKQIGGSFAQDMSQFKMPSPEEERENEILISKLQKALRKATSSQKFEIYGILEENIIKGSIELFQRPKTLEQSQKINAILQNQIWDTMRLDKNGRRKIKLKQIRTMGYRDLANIVDFLSSKTTDLDELNKLYHTLLASPHYDSASSSARQRLTNRIEQIRNYNVLYNLRHNIAPDIQNVIHSLCDGTFNLEEANQAITTEAQKRFDNSTPGRFSLTKERHANQVLVQIRTALAEQGNIFPIIDTDTFVKSIKELDPNVDSSQILHITVNNLISQRRYEEARSFCDQFVKPISLDDYNRTSISQIARNQKRQIIFSEIGQTLLERMKIQASREEDNQFMDALEKKIKSNRIKLSVIPLGMNENETKRITLADIWYKPHQLEL